MYIQQKLNELIKERGITVRHIARKINVAYERIRRCLLGQCTMSADELCAIAKLLNIDIREL